MRSGWPHTQDDHGMLPDRQQQAFGPEHSWPTGYSGVQGRDGDYRYPAPSGVQRYAPAPPALPAPAGEHPYASFGETGYGAEPGGYAQPNFDAFGYGDPGYSDPSYDGPASQDLGVAGTRTVSGFVDPGRAGTGYAGTGYPGTGYAQPVQNPAYMLPPGHPSGAYPMVGGAGDVQPYQAQHQASDMYQQPWDYDQPLRYDGDEPSYPDLDNYGATAYEEPAYNPADYNGSEYSMPGINGTGYDLSGIIQTGEFPEIDYDQPSYDRLSYDDPRYDNASGYDAAAPEGGAYDAAPYDAAPYDGGERDRTRFDLPAIDDSFGMPGRSDTRFDLPALGSVEDFDSPRLDHVWPAAEDLPGETTGYEAPRYGDDVFGGVTQGRSGDGEDQRGLVGYSRRMSKTRFDMPALRDEGPARFDETRIDGMRALAPETGFGLAQETGFGLAPETEFGLARETGFAPAPETEFGLVPETEFGLVPETEFRPTGPGLLASVDDEAMSWADETSLDSFDGAGQVAPLAFRSRERGHTETAGTGSRRAAGKRRGRSGDKRQWMALGAIAVVAVGAVTGAFFKFKTSGPSGPAHTVSTPKTAGKFTIEPNLEQQMKVSTLAAEITKESSGQASDVVSAVYQHGSSAPGSSPQTFIFVGGKVSHGNPGESIIQFDHQYAGAHEVPAGSLGGEAACGEATANGESVAMCVWFDNDTFGDLVSSTMNPSALASTLASVRPSLEHLAQ